MFEFYGLITSDRQKFKKISYGISMLCKEPEIQVVEARYIDEKKPKMNWLVACIAGLLQFLRINFNDIPLFQVNKLPNWIKLSIKNNRVIIFGQVGLILKKRVLAISIRTYEYASKEIIMELSFPLSDFAHAQDAEEKKNTQLEETAQLQTLNQKKVASEEPDAELQSSVIEQNIQLVEKRECIKESQ